MNDLLSRWLYGMTTAEKRAFDNDPYTMKYWDARHFAFDSPMSHLYDTCWRALQFHKSGHDPYIQAVCIAEEAGELLGEARRFTGNARRTGDFKKMIDEMADVEVTLQLMAKMSQVNVPMAMGDFLYDACRGLKVPGSSGDGRIELFMHATVESPPPLRRASRIFSTAGSLLDCVTLFDVMKMAENPDDPSSIKYRKYIGHLAVETRCFALENNVDLDSQVRWKMITIFTRGWNDAAKEAAK